MGTNQDDEIEIDLKELFFVMRRKLWVLILTGMLGAAVSGIFTATMMKPVYTSSTMLYIVNKTTTLTSLTDLQLGSQLTKDYKVLVTSRPVTSKVIENLDLNLDHEQLLRKLTVANPQDTRILTISVEDNDPYMAKAIADEMASVAASRMAEIMDTAPPNIVEEGYVPTRQTSPSLVKNTAIGGMAGLFLAAVIVLAVFVMNDTIKTPEDVEKYLQLNVLGTIPVFEVDDGKKGRKGKKKSRKERKAERLREETEDRIQREIAQEMAERRREADEDEEDIMPHQVFGKRKNRNAARDSKERKQEADFQDDPIDEDEEEVDERAAHGKSARRNARQIKKADRETYVKRVNDSDSEAEESEDDMPGQLDMRAIMDMEHDLPEESVKSSGGQEQRSMAVKRQTASASSLEDELTGDDLDEFVQRIMEQALEGAEAPKEDIDDGTD